MIPYILHVALLISVCLLFYKLLLQKETFYRLNRLVLIFCLALSFTLPLIPVPQQWTLRESAPAVKATLAQPVNNFEQNIAAQKQADIRATITANAKAVAKANATPKVKAVPSVIQKVPASILAKTVSSVSGTVPVSTIKSIIPNAVTTTPLLQR